MKYKWPYTIAFLSSFSKSDFDDLTMGIHGPSDYLRPNYVTQNSAGDDVLLTNSKVLSPCTTLL